MFHQGMLLLDLKPYTNYGVGLQLEGRVKFILLLKNYLMLISNGE